MVRWFIPPQKTLVHLSVWSNTLLRTRWQPQSFKGKLSLQWFLISSYILIFVCFIGLWLCATFQIISYKTCILSSSRAVNVDQHTRGGNEHFSETAVSATCQVYILYYYRKLDRILNPFAGKVPKQLCAINALNEAHYAYQLHLWSVWIAFGITQSWERVAIAML